MGCASSVSASQRTGSELGYMFNDDIQVFFAYFWETAGKQQKAPYLCVPDCAWECCCNYRLLSLLPRSFVFRRVENPTLKLFQWNYQNGRSKVQRLGNAATCWTERYEWVRKNTNWDFWRQCFKSLFLILKLLQVKFSAKTSVQSAWIWTTRPIDQRGTPEFTRLRWILLFFFSNCIRRG